MDQLEQFKDLLSEPKQRIKLHDFVAEVTKSLLPEVAQDKFPVQGPSDRDSLLARFRNYEEILQPVLPLHFLLGRWGLPEHAEIAALPLRRIAGAIAPMGGITYFIEARWYPVFLLLNATCLGAVAGTNYQILHKLFHAPVPNPNGRPNRDILLISVFSAMGEIHDGFKLFPGLDRKHTPRSEHIYTFLEPYADNALYLGDDYDELFDRAEIIMAVEYVHIQHPEPIGKDESPWAPIGRFGWKRSSNPLDRMIAEATAGGKSWEPGRSGLFGGSATRFVELAEGLSRKLNQVSW